MLGQQKCNYGKFGRAVKVFVTFLLVSLAWIFFRMPTLADAVGVITRFFDPTLSKKVFMPSNSDVLFIVMGIIMLFIIDYFDEYYPQRFALLNNRRCYIRWASYLILLISILLTGVFGADQFIYVSF